MIFNSKSAMSPLIATVLLIAFAVALGAMIMNWSAGMEPAGENSSYCNSVSITTSESICHDGVGLHFNIKNDGAARIQGILIRLESSDSDTDLHIKQSALVPNEHLEKIQPSFYPGENTKVVFIPLVDNDGKLQECFESGFSQSKLPLC